MAQARKPWHWIIDHNPCYLLSGLLMLGGCYTVAGSAWADNDNLTPMFLLLGVFELYGLLVLGVTAWLVHRARQQAAQAEAGPGMLRDIGTLMALQCILSVDAAFLYNRLIGLSPGLTVLITGIAFGLVLFKAYVMLRLLRIELHAGPAFAAAVSVALMLAIPPLAYALGEMQTMREGSLLAIWWVAVAAAAAAFLFPRPFEPTEECSDALRQLQRVVVGFMLACPAVSVLAHAGTLAYVYDLQFEPSTLSALLLGAALIVFVRISPKQKEAYAWRLVLAPTLMGLAVFFALEERSDLYWTLLEVQWTPLRLTLAAASIATLIGILRQFSITLTGIMGMQGFCFALGQDLLHMDRRLHQWSEAVSKLLTDMTPTRWGVLAMIAAFVMLGVGMAVSALRSRFTSGEIISGGESPSDGTGAA